MRFETRLEPDRCEQAADLLAALAHPVRLRIVCGLLSGECCVTPMVEGLGLPQAQVSRHLGILRDAGLVVATREGRRQVYRVAHPAVPPLIELLQQIPLASTAGRASPSPLSEVTS
jgi:DNA-binding transcriptional ArsR family regulator